jgi:hypothetical protein
VWGCGKHQTIKDYRPRTVDTLFGRITARCPRFTCSQCGLASLPKLGRSTTEFDEVRAKLAAHLPFRVASNVLTTLLPADSGVTHTTIRNRTAQVAAGLERRDALSCMNGDSQKAAELTLGLDTAFVRSTTPAIARHHGVLVGCVEHQQERRYFSAIQRKTTQATSMIRSQLELSGYHQSTDLTVLTDGAKGLRNLARSAVDAPITPILDWFHVAMRLQHMRQKARGLSTRVPTHREAKKLSRTSWINSVGDFGTDVLQVSNSFNENYHQPSVDSDSTTNRIVRISNAMGDAVRLESVCL